MSEKDIIVTIDSLAFGGKGVGRVEGMVCFVEDALPGEEVLAQITKTKKRYMEGKPLEIISPSPHREKPLCPYFGQCGGCQYQIINYQEELRWKSVQVADSLKRIGGIDAEGKIRDIVASPIDYYYRNNLDLKVEVKDKEVSIGFIHRNNKDIVPIEKCVIAVEKINQELKNIKDILSSKKLKEGTYTLRIKEDSENLNFCLIDSKDKKIIPEEGCLTRRLKGDQTINYSPNTFFQANWMTASLLVEEIDKRVSGLDAECLFDLYCGAGLFSVALSPYVKEVVGIEKNKEAFRFAVKNVKESGVSHAMFYEGFAEKTLPRVWKKFLYQKNIVLLDPPREGCDRFLLDFLARSKERVLKLFYVSCDPACLSKDLKILTEGGFELEEIVPFDMFPKTKHIETLAILV